MMVRGVLPPYLAPLQTERLLAHPNQTPWRTCETCDESWRSRAGVAANAGSNDLIPEAPSSAGSVGLVTIRGGGARSLSM
jgi:hypothetical protein